MLHGALIKFDKIVLLQKLSQKWLEKMDSCTRKALPKTNMDCR